MPLFWIVLLQSSTQAFKGMLTDPSVVANGIHSSLFPWIIQLQFLSSRALPSGLHSNNEDADIDTMHDWTFHYGLPHDVLPLWQCFIESVVSSDGYLEKNLGWVVADVIHLNNGLLRPLLYLINKSFAHSHGNTSSADIKPPPPEPFLNKVLWWQLYHFAGMFLVLPCVEIYTKVDLRTVTFDVPPQEVRSICLSPQFRCQSL